MADGFNVKELTDFEKKLKNLANDKMPKESKKFLGKEGNKLNKSNKSVYKSKGIDAEGLGTGNLLKGFKRGKIYKYNGAWSVRAFNSSPHAHLINYGHFWKPHKKIAKGQTEKQTGEEKFVPGYHFMEDAARAFENEYYIDTEQFLDDVLEKGLGL